jgi:integrase/recombinase XerD
MARHPPRRKAKPGPPRFSTGQYALQAGAPGDLKGLTAAMRRYLDHLAVKGYTDYGRYNVERYLREFIAWADVRAVTHPQMVSRAVLERYQRSLVHYRKKDGNPLSAASQRSKLVPLRGFFKWLTRRGEIPANPAADLDLPRRLKRLPQSVLTEAEAERVLAGADLSSPIGLRDRVMMELLYATGIRRTELARLSVGDIDAERVVVLIRLGKWGKDRMIPLGERALHWIQVYLDRARPELAWDTSEETLFLSADGRALNASWLSTVIAGYVKRAQLGKHGGCHLFRHTMATLMLEGGADVRFIQAMLGHSELSTTQIYTHVAIRQLQQVHAMTHPGARRRTSARPDAVQAADPDLQPVCGLSASRQDRAAFARDPADDDMLEELLEAALDAEAADEADDIDASEAAELGVEA